MVKAVTRLIWNKEMVTLNSEMHNSIGRLQSAVEQLQRDHERATESRNKIFDKLDDINITLQPLARDVAAMKPAWQDYQSDRNLAKRVIYGIAGIAATIGITLSEFKNWVMHWFHG